jgi:UDP:flavonoid glycosyltransferase YjiC (YdhE family)
VTGAATPDAHATHGRRRVVIVAVGSRGDVQPCVALGLGLRDAGFDVVVAAPSPLRTLVTDRGLAFADLRIDPSALLAGDVGRAWVERGSRPVPFLRGVRALASSTAETLVHAIVDACAGADAVVYTTLGFPAWHLAYARGIPAIQASFAPFAPTGAWPPPLLPDPFGRLRRPVPTDDADAPSRLPAAAARTYHRTAHRLLAELLWLPLRRDINRWRREALGLGPVGPVSPGLQVDRAGEPLLHAYSPAVLPDPPDWGAHVTTTGYWFLPVPARWRPPEHLVRFLAAGPPPVSFGLGSMIGRRPAAVVQAMVEALRRTRQRGILLSGWAGLELPPSVHNDVALCVMPEVPHDWLFPRVAAVVHHGGAGTTAAGLRASRPSVVVPHFGDQPLWGARVHALGAGPPPVPRAELTPAAMAHAVAAAVHDRRIAAAAERVGARIRAERGVDRAVAVVEAAVAGVRGAPHPRWSATPT